MTKRKDTKAKAFTCRGAAALITAALLTAALLFTGCPQSPENQTQTPSVQPGPDPNLRIEGGVLKGYNETPSGALIIPEGVTEIADSVFSDCTDLTQVIFPTSLTKIGTGAFASCRGLMQLNLPASLEMLDSYAFYNCTKITGRVILPANLKTIANYAFYSCEKVDAFDFSQCTRITKIGDSAFRHCSKITTVNLPKSLTEIAGNTFVGCTELETLTVQPGGDLIEESGIIYNSGKTKLLCSVPKVTSVSFPTGLKEIVGGAFQDCIGLTQLNLPVSLETIGNDTFSNCTKITGTVVLPANLKTIGSFAFYGCNKVDAFDFSQCTQLTSIDRNAFSSCKEEAVYKVKTGSGIKTLLLDSHSGIKASQITEVP
ncbi:leucine-rich repeat domain-containing protein [Treponema socranskii]|uniref:leucine-rich repeat domain-containing protein n=1 Tax=Treponema socranskii TaxID=53419 RepID=UPI0023F330EC|nr:leucine-rich repeat domain-containing protein [Treponema socranskii]